MMTSTTQARALSSSTLGAGTSVSQKLAPIPEEQPLPPQILISNAQEASPHRSHPNSQSQSNSDRLNPKDIIGFSSSSSKAQIKRLTQTLRQKDSELRALVESLAQRDEEILDKGHEIDDLSSKLTQKETELTLLDGLLDTVYEGCEESIITQNKLLRRELVLVREENRLLRSLGQLRDEDEDDDEDEEDDTTDIEDDDDVGMDDDHQNTSHDRCQSKRKVFALTDADLDIVEGRAAKRQVIYLQETIQDLEKRLKHANLLSSATTSQNNDSGSTSSECDTDAETDIVRHPSATRGHLTSRYAPQGTKKTFSHSEPQKLKRSGTTAHIPTSFLPLPILLSPPSVAPPKFSSSTTESCDRRINGGDDADSLSPPCTPSYASLEALGLAKQRRRGYIGRFWDWIADGDCCSDWFGDQ